MYYVDLSLPEMLLKCAEQCEYCATSCLQEDNVEEMSRCIRLDLECSSICSTTAHLLNLGSDHADAACQLCADICNACAEECEKHHHEHCRECAVMCRECAEQCIGRTAA